MESIIYNYKRKTKALLQNFKIRQIKIQNDNDIVCKLVTSKNKTYNVTIANYNWDYDIDISCDCADFRFNNQSPELIDLMVNDFTYNFHTTKNVHHCKHIYWLGFNHIGHINPTLWTTTMLTDFFEQYLINNDNNVGRNNICSICLDEINYDFEDTIKCVETCDNAVHKQCWVNYFIKTENTQCIYCRNPTMPNLIAYRTYD
jgi:hypothetical protein